MTHRLLTDHHNFPGNLRKTGPESKDPLCLATPGDNHSVVAIDENDKNAVPRDQLCKQRTEAKKAAGRNATTQAVTRTESSRGRTRLKRSPLSRSPSIKKY